MAKSRVLVTPALPSSILSRLSSSCDVTCLAGSSRSEVLSALPGHHVLFCTSFDTVDRELLDAGDSLKAVVTISAGYNHVNVEEIKGRGILLGNTPGDVGT